MTDNENRDEYEQVLRESPPEGSSELITQEHGEAEEAQDAKSKQEYEKLFTLRFLIPLADYIQFHMLMGAQAIEKSRRKATIIGWAEFGLGIIFLLALFVTGRQVTMYYYVMIAILIFIGLYGIVFYRFFYEKMINKTITKQYKKTTYLQNELVVDFYPNKYVEHTGGKEFETYWHSIKEVRVSDALYMIMEEERRCLLIPKASIPEHQEALDALLHQVCANFEKKRYDV
ncbi:YcxB family protein [Oscillospiraceae bacterium PP1C4]